MESSDHKTSPLSWTKPWSKSIFNNFEANYICLLSFTNFLMKKNLMQINWIKDSQNNNIYMMSIILRFLPGIFCLLKFLLFFGISPAFKRLLHFPVFPEKLNVHWFYFIYYCCWLKISRLMDKIPEDFIPFYLFYKLTSCSGCRISLLNLFKKSMTCRKSQST